MLCTFFFQLAYFVKTLGKVCMACHSWISGGTQRLSRVIGPALAKELIFTSRVLDGELAHQYGVVNHCVPQNDAGDAGFQRALQLAQEILPQVC